MRRIQGVLQLVKQYGSAASDNACATALELRVPEYRFVRRYLERSPQAPLSLRQVDPLKHSVYFLFKCGQIYLHTFGPRSLKDFLLGLERRVAPRSSREIRSLTSCRGVIAPHYKAIGRPAWIMPASTRK
jgi:precorrin-6x reductase